MTRDLTSILCRNILEWTDTPADIIDNAYSYIIVIFLGIPVTFLYNTLAGLLRALGGSRTPVIFLVIASVLNISLDLLLILAIPMGVARGIVGLWIVPAIGFSAACFAHRLGHGRLLLGSGVHIRNAEGPAGASFSRLIITLQKRGIRMYNPADDRYILDGK